MLAEIEATLTSHVSLSMGSSGDLRTRDSGLCPCRQNDGDGCSAQTRFSSFSKGRQAGRSWLDVSRDGSKNRHVFPLGVL